MAHAGGRPTKYKPEYAEQAYKYCLLGADNVKLSLMFDVSPSSIDKWIADIPEFSSAVKEGREFADANVAKSLYHRAIGYRHKDIIYASKDGQITDMQEIIKYYPPDTGAAMAWLKNRQPAHWRDKQEVDLSVKEIPAIVIKRSE